jgi:hypothetical protein
MTDETPQDTRRASAIALFRQLRALSQNNGVRHSGIAMDVGLFLFETGQTGLSVNDITARLGYSGPTVRLVIERLAQAGTVELGDRIGKTQLYRLSARGLASFEAYVDTVWRFVDDAGAGKSGRFSAAAAPEPSPDPRANRPRPRGRYGAGWPAQAAAD